MQALRESTESFSKDFSIVQWIVYIFIGSALTAFVSELFIDNYFQLLVISSVEKSAVTISNNVIYFAIGLLAVLFITPLCLSLLLSKLHPKKRLVPPLMIQILAFGWILIYSFSRGLLTGNSVVILLFFGGYYVLIAGIIQDAIMVRLFGRIAGPENIITFSYIADTPLLRTRNILDEEKYRKNFGFGLLKSKENENGSLCFKTSKVSAPQVTLMISKGVNPEQSVVNLAVYGKDRYSLKKPAQWRSTLKNRMAISSVSLTEKK